MARQTHTQMPGRLMTHDIPQTWIQKQTVPDQIHG